MRRVKMRTLMAGPDGVVQPGQEATIRMDQAMDLMGRGYAVWARPSQAEEDLDRATAPTPPLEAATAPPAPEAAAQRLEGPRHVGRGWYELPNGRKVRGHAKAQEVWRGLAGSDTGDPS